MTASEFVAAVAAVFPEETKGKNSNQILKLYNKSMGNMSKKVKGKNIPLIAILSIPR